METSIREKRRKMKDKSRFEESKDIIREELRDKKYKNFSRNEALKKINKEKYPYGFRKYHPYKMWLKALNSFKERELKKVEYEI